MSLDSPRYQCSNVQTSCSLKLLGQSEPNFCEAPMGKANKSLLAASVSHAQDDHHTNIRLKPFKHLFLQN